MEYVLTERALNQCRGGYPVARGRGQYNTPTNTHSLFGRPYRIVDYLLLAGLV